MKCNLDNFIKECQKWEATDDFTVHTPYIAWTEDNKPVIAFEFYLCVTRFGVRHESYYPQSIVYEDLTKDHAEHTKLLFPDFEW